MTGAGNQDIDRGKSGFSPISILTSLEFDFFLYTINLFLS